MLNRKNPYNFSKVKSLLLFAIWQCTETCNDVPPGSALADSNSLHQEFIIYGRREGRRVFIIITLQNNSQQSMILKLILSEISRHLIPIE